MCQNIALYIYIYIYIYIYMLHCKNMRYVELSVVCNCILVIETFDNIIIICYDNVWLAY